MERLRIIVSTPDVPDPFGPTSARWYYGLLKELAERGHRVTCLSFFSKAHEAERAMSFLGSTGLELKLYPSIFRDRHSPLRRHGGRLGQFLRNAAPGYSRLIPSGLERDLDRLLCAGYDLIHLEDLWLGYLGTDRDRALLSIHWLASIDLQHPSPGRRLLARLQEKGERRVMQRFRAIRVLTGSDGERVKALHPEAEVFVVPFAIDPSLYEFMPRLPRTRTVGLIGSMYFRPCRLAAIHLIRSVWPRVRRAIPDAELLIAGWEARRHLATFLREPGVTILDDLPHPRRLFEQVQAFAYPLPFGSGMKVKVLESMAYGVPVVTTTDGIEGIEVEDGIHAFVAADDQVMAERLIELLRYPALGEAMGRASRSLIEERYSPRPVVDRLERVYERIAG